MWTLQGRTGDITEFHDLVWLLFKKLKRTELVLDTITVQSLAVIAGYPDMAGLDSTLDCVWDGHMHENGWYVRKCDAGYEVKAIADGGHSHKFEGWTPGQVLYNKETLVEMGLLNEDSIWIPVWDALDDKSP